MVLILVLMEYKNTVYHCHIFCCGDDVLILVLMEYKNTKK